MYSIFVFEKDNYMAVFCLVLGVLCFTYYAIVHSLSQSFIWILLGVFFIALGVGSDRAKYTRYKKRYIIFLLCIFLCISIFLIPVSRICVNLQGNEKKDLDYIIVLGAKLSNNGISGQLKERCDKAAEYLEENPNTKCIVSGGKGKDEYISEALGMYEYLVGEWHIDKNRIIMENESTNTQENILFSLNLVKLDKENAKVGIVSNDYHLKRARYILSQNGVENINCIPAETYLFYLPHYVLRESFALLKEYITFR